MVNLCESLINVVTQNKPKMLTGLDQKVNGQDQMFFAQLAQLSHHRQIGGTYPMPVFKRNEVSPYPSCYQGNEP